MEIETRIVLISLVIGIIFGFIIGVTVIDISYTKTKCQEISYITEHETRIHNADCQIKINEFYVDYDEWLETVY